MNQEIAALALIVITGIVSAMQVIDVSPSELTHPGRLKYKMIIVLAQLSIMIISAFILYRSTESANQSKNEAVAAANEQRRNDSVTIAVLLSTRDNTIAISSKADSFTTKLQVKTTSIFRLLDSVQSNTVANFLKSFDIQEKALSLAKRMQNPIGEEMFVSFFIYLKNKKLYELADKIPNASPFEIAFMDKSQRLNDSLYKQIDDFLTWIVKDLDINIFFKDSTGHLVLSAHNIIDLSRLQHSDEEYKSSGTMAKHRTWTSLSADKNCHCFRLNIMDFKLNVGHKSPEIITSEDLNGKHLFLTTSYQQTKRDDLFYSGTSEIEKVFDIDIQFFYLNDGKSFNAEYKDLQSDKGAYEIANFHW